MRLTDHPIVRIAVIAAKEAGALLLRAAEPSRRDPYEEAALGCSIRPPTL